VTAASDPVTTSPAIRPLSVGIQQRSVTSTSTLDDELQRHRPPSRSVSPPRSPGELSPTNRPPTPVGRLPAGRGRRRRAARDPRGASRESRHGARPSRSPSGFTVLLHDEPRLDHEGQVAALTAHPGPEHPRPASRAARSSPASWLDASASVTARWQSASSACASKIAASPSPASSPTFSARVRSCSSARRPPHWRRPWPVERAVR